MTSADSLSPVAIDNAVESWLMEDFPNFDVGAAVVGSGQAEANFLLKSSPAVVSGLPIAEKILTRLGCTVEWVVTEGTVVKSADGKNRIKLGVARGPANRLLQAERTALEILTRSSACATYAWRCQTAAVNAYPLWTGRVAATRKTTPGPMRLVEKHGAIIGGADPHRYNLSSMVMLKDNHIDVAGSITGAVKAARNLCGFSTKIEVECRKEEEAIEACKAGADVVMLDNFSPADAKACGRRVKKQFPHCTIEVSGGITVYTVGSYAGDGIDIISIGTITHGTPGIDISMKIVKGADRSRL